MLIYWTVHVFFILFTHLVASLFILLKHLLGSSMLSWVEPQRTLFHDQCLGSSLHSSRSWNMSGSSHQSSPVAISFGTASFQFRSGDRAESGRRTWLLGYLSSGYKMYQFRAGRAVWDSRQRGAQSMAQAYFLCSRRFGITAVLRFCIQSINFHHL